jgi:LEA14-like dessication related protein
MNRLIAVIVVGATVGCASVARQMFREPAVSLRDVRVVGLGVTGGELDVVLAVHNPNNYRLDASRMSYRVFVGDTISLAGGSLDARQTVQAGDSSLVHVPVNFTYAGLGAVGRQLYATGVVNYRVTGDITVWTGISNYTVPFSATGRYSTMRR